MTVPLSQERLEEIRANVRHWYRGTFVNPMETHEENCPGCATGELLAEVERLQSLLPNLSDEPAGRTSAPDEVMRNG